MIQITDTICLMQVDTFLDTDRYLIRITPALDTLNTATMTLKTNSGYIECICTGYFEYKQLRIISNTDCCYVDKDCIDCKKASSALAFAFCCGRKSVPNCTQFKPFLQENCAVASYTIKKYDKKARRQQRLMARLSKSWLQVDNTSYRMWSTVVI